MPMGQHNGWISNYNRSGNGLWNQSYQQPNIMNNTQNQAPITNMISVAGPESAKAYPLQAKSDIVLFDAEKYIFYWKSTDENGFPYPLRAFSFQEINIDEIQSMPEQIDTSNFATKEDLATLKENISDIKEILEGLVN